MHTFRHMGHLFVSSRLVIYADDILLFKKKSAMTVITGAFRMVSMPYITAWVSGRILPNAKSCDLPGKIIALP